MRMKHEAGQTQVTLAGKPMIPDGIVVYGLTHADEVVVRMRTRAGWKDIRTGVQHEDWVASSLAGQVT